MKDDEFTLEKLKIAETINDLKISQATNNTKFDALIEKIDSMYSALMGNNGNPGLIKIVDRHEQTIKGWKDNIKFLWVSVSTIICKIIYDFVRK